MNARADLYGLLAECLSFPGSDLSTALQSGALAATLGHLFEHTGLSDSGQAIGQGRLAAASGPELEAEYIRLFDVPDGSPTPLYTGVYAPRRREAMEELLRAYRYFGLTVSDEAHDLPDFVPTVLEFLRFLSEGAEIALAPGRRSRELATADILQRHLVPWAKHTAERLAKRDPLPFYRVMVEAVGVAAAAHLGELVPEATASAEYAPGR